MTERQNLDELKRNNRTTEQQYNLTTEWLNDRVTERRNLYELNGTTEQQSDKMTEQQNNNTTERMTERTIG